MAKVVQDNSLSTVVRDAIPMDEVTLVLVVSLSGDGQFDLSSMEEFQGTIDNAQGWGHVRLARLVNLPGELDVTP